jgi:16S rRNA (adenine1518-N6/adenine1519-N6)-dimethyltransferase
MVQKEVGDRFFASEGSKSYNALSALLRSTCEKTGTHKVSRTVFAPPPNVDSVLVAFRRTDELIAPERVAGYAAFLRHAFQHRRKTLANNLQTAGRAPREATVEVLDVLGHTATARPEQLSPRQLVALYDALGGGVE